MRFRPYADGSGRAVAAAWARDGRKWRILRLTASEVRKQDGQPDREVPAGRRRGLRDDSDGEPAERYAALWVEKSGDDDARLYLGATDDDLTDAEKPWMTPSHPSNAARRASPDGRVRYSGVWGKPPSAGVTPRLPRPVRVGTSPKTRPCSATRCSSMSRSARPASGCRSAERTTARSKRAEKTLETKPDDLTARSARAGPATARGKRQGAGRPQCRACQEQGRLAPRSNCGR